MLQLNNGVVFTAAKNFTYQFWWRLTSSASVSKAISETEKKMRMKENPAKEHINFDTFREQLCNSLNANDSVKKKIQLCENIKTLNSILNEKSLSMEDSQTIKNAIAEWKKQNATNKSSKKEESLDCLVMILKREAIDKNRNKPVLRYLFDQILSLNVPLNPEQCKSIARSMCHLYYSDKRLLDQICNNLMALDNGHIIPNILVSVTQSMAKMRYKNDEFLSYVCYSINKSSVTSEMIINLLLAVATLNHSSEVLSNIIKKYMGTAVLSDVDAVKWLDCVWALVQLDMAHVNHIRSVLEPTYFEKIMKKAPKQKLHHQLKLLNINGYATSILKSSYTGPFLHDTVTCVTPVYPWEKRLYIIELGETLKFITKSKTCFKISTNTRMGFNIDAELYVKSTNRKVPVLCDANEDDCRKIGVIVLNYTDCYLNSVNPRGLINFYVKLLKANDYSVVVMPYNYFGAKCNVKGREHYLINQLKRILISDA